MTRTLAAVPGPEAPIATPPSGLHGQFTETSYTLPEGLSYDEWAAEAPTLVTMARSAMWWLGDFLAYGEHRYGEKYAQIVEVTGLAVQTLKNAQWVCDRIPPAERIANLPFSHHRAAAALDGSPRGDLLRRAVEEHMTEGEVRGRVRALKGETAKPAPVDTPPSLHDAAVAAVRLLYVAHDSRDWTLVVDARNLVEEALG